MLAYLVIREGTKWTDVYRLTPGRTVTIGRAATNQIVVKDERSSRYHAEIFLSQGQWVLRDLDSRNGTLVGGERVRGDFKLTAGDIIRIAHCQLAFVHDVAQAFADSSAVVKPVPGEETLSGVPVTDSGTDGARDGDGEFRGPKSSDASDEISDSNVSESEIIDPPEPLEPPLITHRRGQTKFLDPKRADEISVPGVGQAATKLCRLAFELANQPDTHSVARVALQGLLEGTNVDAGAVLMVPRNATQPPTVADLQLLAWRSELRPTYHRVSRFVATTVLHDGEAVLARNVEDDVTLGNRDSKGEISSTGVICAPIRQGGKVVGLIHLYSTVSERTPTPDDLEFTLAVAENVALAMKNLARQQELAENLSHTQNEIVQLRKRLGAESELIGSSPALMQVQADIERAAPSRATVLIRGESGVGKELVAQAIHFASPRNKGAFVCLNCAALTETLLESELFGHEKGSFTGATDRKIGKFEASHLGTLMLDEIGEMSPSIQAKFLRVLEGHPFERVGGNQAIKVDVRVIAATNRDLEKAVTDGSFRRDLFFRLRVVEITVPPLRKRGDDVIQLALHFLQRFNQETGRKIRSFTAEAIEQMRRYRWPGNIRELKNVVERAVVLAPNDYIGAEDLILTTLATSGESGEVIAPKSVYEPLSLEEVERRHILHTLNATGWNKSRTSAVLGIERSTLDRKLKRYHVPRPLTD